MTLSDKSQKGRGGYEIRSISNQSSDTHQTRHPIGYLADQRGTFLQFRGRDLWIHFKLKALKCCVAGDKKNHYNQNHHLYMYSHAIAGGKVPVDKIFGTEIFHSTTDVNHELD